MVTIVDVLGAMVEAQLKAAEWEAEFQAAFNAPLKLVERVQAFLATPPEQRAGMAADMHAPLAEHARRMQQQMGQPIEQMGGGANVPTPGG